MQIQKQSIIFGFFFFLTSLSLGFSEEVILTTGEWAPYTTKKLEGKGYCSEIISNAFKNAGMDVTFKFFPWKRAEKSVSAGKSFGCFPYLVSVERQKEFDFSDDIAFSRGVFFFRKDKLTNKPTWQDISDLKHLRIGGVLGYWYEKEKLFEKSGIKVDYVAKDALNVKKLDKGRVDLIILDEVQGWDIIKLTSNNAKHFDTLDKPLNESKLHVMVSRKYPNSKEILAKFNTGLRKFKQQPEYIAILKRFGLK
jgi:polar amino acid transport system substrate-binding protein